MGNCGAKTNAKEDVAAERRLPSELTLKKKAELQKVLDADSIKREVFEGGFWNPFLQRMRTRVLRLHTDGFPR